MKYARALEYVLQNAPVRAKEPEKKVCEINSSFHSTIKSICFYIEKSRSYGIINYDENQTK
jgi:hypothetical protein